MSYTHPTHRKHVTDNLPDPNSIKKLSLTSACLGLFGCEHLRHGFSLFRTLDNNAGIISFEFQMRGCLFHRIL